MAPGTEEVADGGAEATGEATKSAAAVRGTSAPPRQAAPANNIASDTTWNRTRKKAVRATQALLTADSEVAPSRLSTYPPAARRVFPITIATVMGPTPPGTGVIALATSETEA